MPGPVVDPPITQEQRLNTAAQVITLRTELHFVVAQEIAAEVLSAVDALMKPLPRCGHDCEEYQFRCNREPGHPPPHEAYGFDHDRPLRTW